MKRFIYNVMILCAATLFMASGCDKDSKSGAELMIMSASPMQFSHAAKNASLKFVASGHWSISADADWITVAPTSGDSDGKETVTVKVAVAANDSKAREGEVVVKTGAKEVKVRVEQESGEPVRVRLLYWNIQYGMWADQGSNYDNFVAWIKEINPDICVWNEAKSAYYTGTTTRFTSPSEFYLPGNWSALAKRYGHNFVASSPHSDSFNFPQVVTTRNYEIQTVNNFRGSTKDTLITRYGAQQKVIIDSKALNIITLHLWPNASDRLTGEESIKAGAEYRKKELTYIFKRSILKDKDAAENLWMCLGDFNSRSSEDQWHYKYTGDNLYQYIPLDYLMSETPFKNVMTAMHPGEHHSTTYGDATIDYVFVTPRLLEGVKSASIVKTGFPGNIKKDPVTGMQIPSDHRPIVVDFEIL